MSPVSENERYFMTAINDFSPAHWFISCTEVDWVISLHRPSSIHPSYASQFLCGSTKPQCFTARSWFLLQEVCFLHGFVLFKALSGTSSWLSVWKKDNFCQLDKKDKGGKRHGAHWRLPPLLVMSFPTRNINMTSTAIREMIYHAGPALAVSVTNLMRSWGLFLHCVQSGHRSVAIKHKVRREAIGLRESRKICHVLSLSWEHQDRLFFTSDFFFYKHFNLCGGLEQPTQIYCYCTLQAAIY